MAESSSDIREKLTVYKTQYEQILRMLAGDSKNAELQAMKGQFGELITVTEELYQAKLAEEQKASAKPAPSLPPPPKVAAAPEYITINCRVKAKSPIDGQMREAVVINVANGTAVVKFTHNETVESLPFSDIKPYTSVMPEGRKRLALPTVDFDDSGNAVIPDYLKIKPTDTEEEKAKKKAKIHNIKSAGRLQVAEKEQDSKKSSWQKFTTKKSVKKVFSKESIFRTSDSGKVGVTGSGQQMTNYVDGASFRVLAKTSIPILSKEDQV